MRFLTVELENVRGLRGPLKIELKDGINVVFGPNEIGKSTVEQAIWAGLSMPAKGDTEAHRALRPRSGGDPRIKLVFEHKGDRFTLEKELSGQKGKTGLAIVPARGPAEQLSGGEAEDRLRAVLGLGEVVRGEVKAENQGFWPLIRITRESAVAQPGEQLTRSSRATLGERLAAQSGEVLAGDVGEGVLERAREEFERFFTPGKAQEKRGGPLQKSRSDREEAERQLTELRERRQEHERDVDGFSRLEDRVRTLEIEAPRHQQALRQARERADSATQMRADAKLAEGERQQADSDARLWQARIDEGRRLAEALGRAQAERLTREQALRELERVRAEHNHGARSLSRHLDQDEQKVGAAERWERRLSAWNEARLGRRQRELLSADLRDARLRAEEATRLRAELAGLGVDEEALRKLDALAEQSARARAKLEVASTEVEVRALAPLELRVDGQPRPMAPGEEARFTLPRLAVLRLSDLAEIEVRPGGSDLAKLADAARAAGEALRAELDRMGLADVEEGRRRLSRRRMAELELKNTEENLRRFAPSGLPALELELEKVSRTLERAEGLAEPAAGPPLPGDDAVERELELARDDLSVARGARDRAAEAARAHERRDRELHEQVLRAEADFAAAVKAAENAQTALSEHRARFPEAEEALAIAASKRDAAQARRAQVEAALAQPELAWADKDLERTEGLLQQHRRELDEARSRLDQVRGRLSAGDALGLHERLAEAEARVESAKEAERIAARDAEAARLLWETLRACRDEARERYLAPLQREAAGLLQLLFPGGRIELDEKDYGFSKVHRGEEQDEFGQLSSGAREQLGLVVRLAMARLLAGDDTLPILLDDALVGTDEARLAGMVRVLYSSTPKLQVLLFTCHWDRLRAAGLLAHNLVDMEALRRG